MRELPSDLLLSLHFTIILYLKNSQKKIKMPREQGKWAVDER